MPSTTARTASATNAALESLGSGILAFLATRLAPPPAPSEAGVGVWGTQAVLGGLRDMVDRRQHEADTLKHYRDRFGQPVLDAMDALIDLGSVSELEADRLVAPSTAAEIEHVAVRLIQLANSEVAPPGRHRP